MTNFLNMIRESDEYSLVRTAATLNWMLFALVSIFLVACDKNWANYSTFAQVTTGSGSLLLVVNKGLNAVYGTNKGEPNKPMNTKIGSVD